LAMTFAMATLASGAQAPGSTTLSVDPLELVKQARKLNSEGQQDAALALYRQALERSPELFDAHVGAGIALDLQAKYREARQVAIVETLLDKHTNDDQRIQYPYLVGYVDLYLKDHQGAVAELQKADQRDPFILALLAQAYEKLGDASKARDCYTQALASNAH